MTDWHAVARQVRDRDLAATLARCDARAGAEVSVEGDVLTVRAQSRVRTTGPDVGTYDSAVWSADLWTLRYLRATLDPYLGVSLRDGVLAVQPHALSWIVGRVREALDGATGVTRWPDPTLAREGTL